MPLARAYGTGMMVASGAWLLRDGASRVCRHLARSFMVRGVRVCRLIRIRVFAAILPAAIKVSESAIAKRAKVQPLDLAREAAQQAAFLHDRKRGCFALSPMRNAYEIRSKTLSLVQDLEKTFCLRLEFCIVGTHCKNIASCCVRPHCANPGCRPKARPTFFTT